MLSEAYVLLDAEGPAELEQRTGELLGAELYRVLTAGYAELWFDHWFDALADAVITWLDRLLAAESVDWRQPWWLLHGLSSICRPDSGSRLRAAIEQRTSRVSTSSAPKWLRHLTTFSATGEAWWMVDGHGTRFAVIAGYSSAGGEQRSAFLFDVDASGLVSLAHAGAFPDVCQAADAWRSGLGDTAVGVRPRPVRTPADGLRLLCLAHCELTERVPVGDETRTTLDNWFRATRRFADLAVALADRGTPLPPPRSLYDADPSDMIVAFTDWFVARHGRLPKLTAVEALAKEWLDGILPETRHGIPPGRVERMLLLLDDWLPDDPVTIAAKTLLPEWIRWHAEVSGLATHLVDRALQTLPAQWRSVNLTEDQDS